MDKYENGLEEAAIARRAERKHHILQQLGGTDADWDSYEWQVSERDCV